MSSEQFYDAGVNFIAACALIPLPKSLLPPCAGWMRAKMVTQSLLHLLSPSSSSRRAPDWDVKEQKGRDQKYCVALQSQSWPPRQFFCCDKYFTVHYLDSGYWFKPPDVMALRNSRMFTTQHKNDLKCFECVPNYIIIGTFFVRMNFVGLLGQH
jgi:hypothetical protein